VNEAHNHRRWFLRHRRGEVGLEEDAEETKSRIDVIADSGQSPFDYVADRETHTLIEGALARINPAFREAVVLRDISDLSYEEIAEVLQISLGTVKSRILRGREALREELEGRLEPQPALRLIAENGRMNL
jgi:RNA polymerase sigma-70 factor (ECF subfamily)